MRWVGVASALVVGLGGCGGSEPTSAPRVCNVACVRAGIDLTVKDAATGAPVTDAVASGPEVSCATDGAQVFCSGGTAGTYAIDVSAPGFAAAHVSVDVKSGPGPCSCPVATSATVALSPQ